MRLRLLTSLFVLIALVLSGQSNVQAQTVLEKRFKLKDGQNLLLDFKHADTVAIKPWNKNEVWVKAYVNINEGMDNDKFSLEVGDITDGKSVVASMPASLLSFIKMYLAEGKRGTVKYRGISVSIRYEIHLPNKANIKWGAMNENLTLHLPEDYVASTQIPTITD